MCARKLVVLNRICLGAREICYEAYSLPKEEVVEVTEKQLRDYLKFGKDEVYGLELSKANELVFATSFYTTNMMNKVHTGTLTPMVEGETPVNLFYIVIGTHKENNETMYDVISSRFQRISFGAEKVKALLEMQIISGGCCLDEKGEIVVAPLEKAEQIAKAVEQMKRQGQTETIKTVEEVEKVKKPVEVVKATEPVKEAKKSNSVEEVKEVKTAKSVEEVKAVEQVKVEKTAEKIKEIKVEGQVKPVDAVKEIEKAKEVKKAAVAEQSKPVEKMETAREVKQPKVTEVTKQAETTKAVKETKTTAKKESEKVKYLLLKYLLFSVKYL